RSFMQTRYRSENVRDFKINVSFRQMPFEVGVSCNQRWRRERLSWRRTPICDRQQSIPRPAPVVRGARELATMPTCRYPADHVSAMSTFTDEVFWDRSAEPLVAVLILATTNFRF